MRAVVRGRKDTNVIDRYRFLALTEFGPWNVIYHEGKKHRVNSIVVPPEGIEGRLTQARLCNECGYAHWQEALNLDNCENCGEKRNGTSSFCVSCGGFLGFQGWTLGFDKRFTPSNKDWEVIGKICDYILSSPRSF